jgi:hypothetical protein
MLSEVFARAGQFVYPGVFAHLRQNLHSPPRLGRQDKMATPGKRRSKRAAPPGHAPTEKQCLTVYP